MCGTCKEGCESKGVCTMHMITKILVIIGGINWGLVGLGMLLGNSINSSWNLVHFVLGFSPLVEGVVYLLVGISAIMMIFNCKCKKCVAPTEFTQTTKTTETTSSTPSV